MSTKGFPISARKTAPSRRSAGDGGELWKKTGAQLGDQASVRVISAAEETIYVAFSNFKIIAFDGMTGEIRNVYVARSESGVQIVPSAMEFCEGADWFALSGAYGQRNAIALFDKNAQGTLEEPVPCGTT